MVWPGYTKALADDTTAAIWVVFAAAAPATLPSVYTPLTKYAMSSEVILVFTVVVGSVADCAESSMVGTMRDCI